MVSHKRKAGFGMIEFVFIEECNTGIKSQMFFVTIDTRCRRIDKMESMAVVYCFAYFRMADEAFAGTDDISAIMALCTVGHSFQWLMAAGQFSR
jgi:hypothetical protein